MKRRRFLQQCAALSIAAGYPAAAQALPMLDPFAPLPGPWRTYEITTTVELVNAQGPAQAWIPLPALAQPAWIRPQQTRRKTNATTATVQRDAASGTQMLYAQWASSAATPAIELVSRVATRDRTIDFKKPGAVTDLTAAERARYTAGSASLPIDGVVKSTADQATSAAVTELAKARAIYDWVVDNTVRDPATPGCGSGNIAATLQRKPPGGKSADINGLYVALARACGLPARVLYGIRTGPSSFYYKSLGPATGDITREQDCRAEVFLTGIGWVPVDAAAVRQILLEEPPGHLSMDAVVVTDARSTLFGAWETNWIAYNDGQDVPLPGSGRPALPFLIYPQAQAGGAALDPLKPDQFRYTIASREIT